MSKAREQLAELVNRAAYGRERISIGRRGRRVAVLLPAEDLELLEALEDAADLRLIAKALADPENAGDVIPWKIIEVELAKRV